MNAQEKQPSVTWLLSVRNGMPFLPETLASIYAQTYKNHKLLVWDDCSNDGSSEELRRWIPYRIPGQIFRGESFRLGRNLAFLVEKADTELCARIDGDDVNHPQRLERQVEFMLAHPEIGVLGSLTEHIDEHGIQHPAWYYPLSDAEIRWRSRWQPSLCHPTVMFRRSAVLAAGNYRDFRLEDFDLWMRMSLSTQFHNLAEPLVQYRRHTSSLTGKVIDFYPFEKETAVLNASVLFPNLLHPARAMKVWEATHPNCLQRQPELGKLPILLRSLHDYRLLREFEGAALSLARQTGQPDNYFTSTTLFQNQRYYFRRYLLQRAGVARLQGLRARLLYPRKQVA